MSNIKLKIKNLLHLRSEIGFRNWIFYLVSKSIQKIYYKLVNKKTSLAHHKTNYFNDFSFLIQKPFGEEINKIENLNPKSINWVIPDIGIGSGGHLNIFRLISNLENQGYECSIIINGGSHLPSEKVAKDVINRHFLPIKSNVVIGQQKMQPAWFTFATSWQTAYTVKSFRSTHQKLYLVQDFEPWFYPQGSEYVLAEQTYRFGFVGITAGSWLSNKLQNEFGMQTFPMSFSFDRDKYRPFPKIQANEKKVFFYARQNTPRRGFELGLLVLGEVAKVIPNFHAVIAGCDTSNFEIPFKHTNLGIAKLDDLPKIYSQCEAALILSFTNLSLLPLEVMACGCPVISNTGPNVEWMLNSENAFLSSPTIIDLTEALINVLTKIEVQNQLILKGLDFSKTTDWFKESEKVAKVLASI